MHRRLALLSALLLLSPLAHADVVIEETIDGPGIKGAIRFRVKGDKARVDMPGPNGSSMSSYVDAVTGEATTLNHVDRTAIKTNFLETARLATEKKKAAGQSTDPVVPVKTGKTDRIGSWNADEYVADVNGTKLSVWVSTDVPNWASLKKQMAPFQKATGAGSFDPSTFAAPGYIVKTETISINRKVTIRLFSAEERPVNEADLVIPGGYKIVPLPTPPPAAPAAPALPK